ncbi:mRNA-binding protein PUF3 [Nakaseomyces bracarensis]|uniref:mRNA-binding protein PUF3 n=1 Tax=Nakaseomyces bracarensis TaxID=273131 RepID=A0ABR4P0M8_9SACH
MPGDGVWGSPIGSGNADLLPSLSKTTSRTSDDHNMSTNSYLSLSSMGYANNSNNPGANHMDPSIDAELASIVSSLSALSHSNTNQMQQNSLLNSPNLNKVGTSSSQIGGFRRSSFTSDHTGNEHLASENTTASLSVGTAPPYYYSYQGNTANSTVGGNMQGLTTSLSSQRLNYLNQNQYSASIAGPILFSHNDNGSHQTGSVGGHQGNQVGGNSGFFEKFGKTLVEGTKELEANSGYDTDTVHSSKSYTSLYNNNENTPIVEPIPTAQQTMSSSAIDDSASSSSSTSQLTLENAESKMNMRKGPNGAWKNVAETPVFKPNLGPLSFPNFQGGPHPNFPMFNPFLPMGIQNHAPPMPNNPNVNIDHNANINPANINPKQNNEFTNRDTIPANIEPDSMHINPQDAVNNVNNANNSAPYFYYPINIPPENQHPINNNNNPHPMQKKKRNNDKKANAKQQQSNMNPYLDSHQPQLQRPYPQKKGQMMASPPAARPMSPLSNQPINFYKQTSQSSSPAQHSNSAASNNSSQPGKNSGNSNNHSSSGNSGTANFHRSPLLEELRANPTNNDLTLKSIYGHALEFCKDQHGSRFIQRELATAPPPERELVFNEIRDHALSLANDVFGNYVIQKFFEYGSKTQKDILVEQFRGKMEELSLQMYACRVIQRALEFIDAQQRIDLVNELSHCVLQMIKDQNGNHVIQKAIECIPIDLLPFILKSLQGHIYHLSTHSYGCRVVQRLLEFGSLEDQQRILEELKDFIPYLIQDQYGNYVIQHILQHGSDSTVASDHMRKIKQEIIDTVSENIVEFSKHKFASNVVEKAIIYGDPQQKEHLMNKILPKNKEHAANLEDDAPLILMMRDQFANYVVQKLVVVSQGDDKKLIVVAIRAYLDKLNKSASSGNRHLASVEKLASLVETVEI